MSLCAINIVYTMCIYCFSQSILDLLIKEGIQIKMWKNGAPLGKGGSWTSFHAEIALFYNKYNVQNSRITVPLNGKICPSMQLCSGKAYALGM